VGVFPVHGALTPNKTNYYVASSDGTISTGTVTSSAPPTIVNLPVPCANCTPKPSFVHSTENARMYVADSANGTVSVINTSSNVVVQTVAVDPSQSQPDPNSRPVALAELPNGSKIYSVNKGTSRVTSINTVDGSIANVINITTGSPIWAVASADNIHVYVLDSSGTISVISSLSDAITTHSASAGAGANFMLYDKNANLLYVTNPAASSLTVFDVSQDPPLPRTGGPIPILSAGPGCTSAVHPASVTVLGDGSRAYVASYQADLSGTVCTQVSVINTGTLAVTKTIPLAQSGSAPQSQCSTAPFRVFTVAANGGSTDPFKVYVSQCDAGAVAIIDTFAVNTGPDPHGADVVIANLPAPVSEFPSSQLSISGVTATAATATTPAMATYSYSLVNGAALQPGTVAYVSGMTDAPNNGPFVIATSTASTFTVVSPSGVTASNQSGAGSAVPAQNPIFILAGQ
jgi:YVTN family beta-propeller protein